MVAVVVVVVCVCAGVGKRCQTLCWLETDRGIPIVPSPTHPCEYFEPYAAISCIWAHLQCNLSMKKYIYYHLTLHLGTFVICFLLLHTEIEGKCGM